jgi:hypothetical protein
VTRPILNRSPPAMCLFDPAQARRIAYSIPLLWSP